MSAYMASKAVLKKRSTRTRRKASNSYQTDWLLPSALTFFKRSTRTHPAIFKRRSTLTERNVSNNYLSDSLLADESIKWQEKVAVGIRFKPNDQVLAGYYLAGKVSGCTDGPIFPLIKEVDVYQYEPAQLPRLAYDFGGGEMYFFTRLNKGMTVVDRRVPSGVWKKTGEPSYVNGKDRKPIATKTTFGYYNNNKTQTDQYSQWLAKEYVLLPMDDNDNNNNNNEESWRLCVVYYSSREQGQSECNKMSDDDDDDEEENNFSCDSSGS